MHGQSQDGLVHQIAPDQIAVAGGRVALGEDEVDDVQNQAQTAVELVRAGHAEGDAALLDLALAAGEALGHRVAGGDEEGLCDLSGAEARDVAQGESGLRVQVESRVTAREHELQPVVGDVPVLCDRLCAARRIGIGVQSGELPGQRGVPPGSGRGPCAGPWSPARPAARGGLRSVARSPPPREGPQR